MPPTVADLARRFLAEHSPDLALALDFGGFRVALRTDSALLRDTLAFYYRDFLADGGRPEVTVLALEAPSPDPGALGLSLWPKPPEPGKTRVKEEFQELPDGRAVRKRLTGMLFLFGQQTHLALGPCVANHNQVVNFINNRHIQYCLDHGCLLFHAAGVARGGRGLALAGFAGMGKSTLALEAMRLGLDFVSNDRLMVRREGEGLAMFGVAKAPRVNPGTVLGNPALAPVMPEADRARFSALPPEQLWPLEHKYDAFIDQCFGPGRFSLSAAMAGLVLLNWRRGGPPPALARVDLGAREDLWPAFMKDVGLFYAQDGDLEGPAFTPAAYLDLLAGCPVFELTGGVDFPAAAGMLLDLF